MPLVKSGTAFILTAGRSPTRYCVNGGTALKHAISNDFSGLISSVQEPSFVRYGVVCAPV